jgi:hypothetical protein
MVMDFNGNGAAVRVVLDRWIAACFGDYNRTVKVYGACEFQETAKKVKEYCFVRYRWWDPPPRGWCEDRT